MDIEVEKGKACKHAKLTLVSSPIWGYYLWCPSCHNCWPPQGMNKPSFYCWWTKKQAEKYAKGHRMEIVDFLNQWPKEKPKRPVV